MAQQVSRNHERFVVGITINIFMSSTSREYAKFKRLFVGPKLKRKQRLDMAPPMPAEKPKIYPKLTNTSEFEKLAPEDQKKALWSAYVVARRRSRDKSMPQWANKTKINRIYLQARHLTVTTGIRHEVDHIIPSNHLLVCGLHVENNLQILTESDNQKKSNNFSID